MRSTFVVAALSCAIAALALSQPPSPGRANASQEQQQQPTSKNSDTAVGPPATPPMVVVQQPQVTPPTTQPSSNSNNQKQQTTLDWWLQVSSSLANVVIALVTIALAIVAIVQAKFMREGLTETRKAADAAKQSADAAQDGITLARKNLAFAIAQKRNAEKQFRLQMAQVALENRGYIHIGGWQTAALNEHQSIFCYTLSNRGKTDTTIERGEIRASVDTPVEFKGRFEIPSQSIGPHERTPEALTPMATFGPLPAEILKARDNGKPPLVFLSGDIWYRDAFPNTSLHRKRFGVKCEAGIWVKNEAVPNDEIDE